MPREAVKAISADINFFLGYLAINQQILRSRGFVTYYEQVDTCRFDSKVIHCLTLSAPTPQNGQTHSNNSSATADKLYECI